MALIAPKLDDRHFQDIVDEAKKRIPHYSKEWTDHNVSDPGVTMIELFAWMTDIILYRLNRVPDRHYIKFMDMLGIRLREPEPAEVPVTFWLSAPQPTRVVIPAGTEVASTQTETERSIVFTTDENFAMDAPQLANITTRVAATDGKTKVFQPQNLRRIIAGFDGYEAFSSFPQIDDAMYFGFENDLSYHILGFEFETDPAGGAGIDPSLPPYVWEASTGQPDASWEMCAIDIDTTKGLNVPGRIHIHVPQMGKWTENKETYYWIRVRVRPITAVEQREGMRPYKSSPRIRKVDVQTWGGTIVTTHSQQLDNEFLGQSDGSAGQRYQLQVTPILARRPNETLVVRVPNGTEQEWKEVADFGDSTGTDRHFTLDSITGELRLGPAIRQPDGSMKMYSDIPPRGATLFFRRYRFGGGQEGNVQTGVLNTLKTAIPFIARVQNLQPAWGGLDAESLEAAMIRTPSILRSRNRAVTEADFEFLAREALPATIGRVKCLQPRPSEAGRVAPGQVYVLVIPRVPNPAGFLSPSQLELDNEEIRKLTTYLDERRLLTTRLDTRAPAYRWVAVRVQLRPTPGADTAVLEAEVLSRLYRFLNPLKGGADGNGWPFGRDLFESDVYQSLQGTPNAMFIREVELFITTPGGSPQGNPVETVEVVAHGVIASGKHEVKFI